MRRVLLVGAVVGLLVPAGAHAATLGLRVDPGVARYGQTVVFAGELVPAESGVQVGVYIADSRAWKLVASGLTAADGSYRLATAARAPATYLALAQLDAATQVASGQVGVRIRPSLTARVSGRRSVGERLVLSGRLLPADAGRLTLTVAGRKTRVAVGPAGRFRAAFSAPLPGRVRYALALAPRPGYERSGRQGALRIRAPRLVPGSSGAAGRALERRLADLHYVLRGVDSSYGGDTYEAVMAFQKVHGLARTGRAGADVWRRLVRARVPRAFVPRGTHIEISKTKQVMFEVVNGEVVRAVHVSTGATGNTPVGRWRVYRLGPGYNALGMYYSLYFLRGFAIHGYRSVPPWPASHGCIRTPIWFARAFYARWGRLGTSIMIFP